MAHKRPDPFAMGQPVGADEDAAPDLHHQAARVAQVFPMTRYSMHGLSVCCEILLLAHAKTADNRNRLRYLIRSENRKES